jgi:8-oxo-dGTP pyrophosphatase MutT (NUDIX family)
MPDVRDLLARYRPGDPAEAADLDRTLAMTSAAADPWRRDIPLHVTGSALIVHPASGRVLLRWHERQQAWLQVGGHGDPGESDPLAIALREAREETGLADLVPWPDAQLRHLVIVAVPANAVEPAHEHADLRFILATRDPDAARPERPGAPLRWLSFREALELTAEDNLRETLARAERLVAAGQGVTPAQ